MLANEISRDAVRGYDLQLQRAKPEKSSRDTKKSPSASISEGDLYGADTRIRTGDLILTKGVKIKQYIEYPWYLHEDITSLMFMFYNHIYIQEENHEESIHDQEPQT